MLRPHSADLVSIFCHYCKQGGADGAGAGWRSMDEVEWAQMTREVEAGPAPAAANGGGNGGGNGSVGGGASYGAALVASARVFAHVRGPRAKDIGMVKFFQALLTYAPLPCYTPLPCYAPLLCYQALLTYAFVRHNPWHDPAAEAAEAPPTGAEVVPMPVALHALLQGALLPRARRDESLALRKAYSGDKKLQSLLAERHGGFAQLYSDAGGVLVAGSAGGASVSLAGFLGICTKRGLLGEKSLRNTSEGVTPPPDGRKKHFKVALSKPQLLASFLDSQVAQTPKPKPYTGSIPNPPSLKLYAGSLTVEA